MKEDFDCIRVDYWKCPEENGVPILTMPCIPKALMGNGMQPRTIFGKTTWDYMRKRAYYLANYKSEVSESEAPKGQLHAHELFEYDYTKHEGKFVRIVVLTKMEHDFIHSGRLVTLYKEGNPTVPKSYLLKVVENGFRLVSEWNESHPDEEPLRVYRSFLDYLEVDNLREEMIGLIKRYKIKFYRENVTNGQWFKGWHVIVGSNRYETPYKNQAEWEEAMRGARENDTVRKIESPFVGGVYDEMEKILNGDVKPVTKIAGCGSGRLTKRSKDGQES